MSRSNPTTKNPAVKFFSWSGSTGELVHYDKELEKRVSQKLPFTFIVLDELNTITGFSDEDTSSYWSNEVRNIKNDELIVKTSKGTRATGKYDELTEVRSKGAKYAKSVYIAYQDGGHKVIANFKVYGAALTSWIDFTKKANIYQVAVTVAGKEEAKKGTTTYFTPVFESKTITQEENEEAVALDRELQTYLNQYFAIKEDDEAERPSLSGQPPIEAYADEGEPISLENIPF